MASFNRIIPIPDDLRHVVAALWIAEDGSITVIWAAPRTLTAVERRFNGATTQVRMSPLPVPHRVLRLESQPATAES